MSTDTNGNKKKTNGKPLFWIGIAGIVISIAIFLAGARYGTEPEAIPYAIIGFSGVLISTPLIAGGNTRNIVGNFLLEIGITGTLISFIMFLAGCGAMYTDSPERMGSLVGIFGIPIFFPIITAGLGLKKARECPTSLHFGIFSLILPVFGIISGLLAIIFGAVALAQIKRNPTLGDRTTAIAGLVLGVGGITIWTWASWAFLTWFLS